MIAERSTNYVFACGGGIVEIPEARKLLVDYHSNKGNVLLAVRDINKVMDFLKIDQTRPAYVEDMMGCVASPQAVFPIKTTQRNLQGNAWPAILKPQGLPRPSEILRSLAYLTSSCPCISVVSVSGMM